MTIGDFVAFNSYIVYLSGPVRTLSVFHLGLQPILASLERLMEIFRMTPETASAAGGQGERLQAVAGRVEFRGVSFAYRSGFPVLRDVAFAAEPGDVVALVGPSGAGKSTLVSLLLAFYRPDAGAILLDGRDVRGLDTVWLRRQIGFVPQEGFLFADTVRNNIRYGNPSASDEAVIEAARAANVHEDIVALPEGYDTIAGERGSKLSVGQKQRVSIARAFLNNPPILVFDEPTSALDARSEALLKDSLSRLLAGRTTFIIAHRLSTISLARRIIVLDQGRLVENGTHEELLAHGSLYRQLYDSHRTAV
jgi:ABC-type multidrug transport system fused ATPase/permease subunit